MEKELHPYAYEEDGSSDQDNLGLLEIEQTIIDQNTVNARKIEEYFDKDPKRNYVTAAIYFQTTPDNIERILHYESLKNEARDNATKNLGKLATDFLDDAGK